MWCASLYIEMLLEYVVVGEGELDRNVIRKRAEGNMGKFARSEGTVQGVSLLFVCEPGNGPLCCEV